MNEQLQILLRKPWVLPTAVGVASFGGGLAAGYFASKFKMEREIEADRAEQLSFNFEAQEEQAKLFGELSNVTKELKDMGEELLEKATKDEEHQDNVADAAALVEETLEIARAHPSQTVDISTNDEDDDTSAEVDASVISIFKDNEDEWDYEAELSTRKPDAPYILHRDEFFNDEMGLSQSTLTYYAGDDILVDELEVPIYNYPEVVGELKFGHGSHDQNVVYVRNERFKAEYEVLHDEGSYEVEVLGGGIGEKYERNDIRHSKHAIYKFKEE